MRMKYRPRLTQCPASITFNRIHEGEDRRPELARHRSQREALILLSTPSASRLPQATDSSGHGYIKAVMCFAWEA